MLWINQELVDVDKHYGFIYELVYHLDGKVYTYIGKTQINSYISKDALQNGDKREGHLNFYLVSASKGTTKVNVESVDKNGVVRILKRAKKELLKKESSWKSYKGSCKDDRVKSMQLVSKEILELVDYSDKAKTTLSYLEENYLHRRQVLHDKFNLNGNIAGKYFAGRIKGDKLDESSK